MFLTSYKNEIVNVRTTLDLEFFRSGELLVVPRFTMRDTSVIVADT